MWNNGTTNYNRAVPSDQSHTPYTSAMGHDHMTVRHEDIAIHGFRLTDKGYVPKDVIQACREEARIWWPGRPGN